eukprot:13573870-Alexandrium_andersonii.AAC.1
MKDEAEDNKTKKEIDGEEVKAAEMAEAVRVAQAGAAPTTPPVGPRSDSLLCSPPRSSTSAAKMEVPDQASAEEAAPETKNLIDATLSDLLKAQRGGSSGRTQASATVATSRPSEGPDLAIIGGFKKDTDARRVIEL